MLVLIFGKSEEMQAAQRGISALKHEALHRNPAFFSAQNGQFEPAAAVVIDPSTPKAPAIIAAYEAIGAHIYMIGAQILCSETQDAECLGHFEQSEIEAGEPFAALRKEPSQWPHG